MVPKDSRLFTYVQHDTTQPAAGVEVPEAPQKGVAEVASKHANVETSSPMNTMFSGGQILSSPFTLGSIALRWIGWVEPALQDKQKFCLPAGLGPVLQIPAFSPSTIFGGRRQQFTWHCAGESWKEETGKAT